VQQKIRRPEMLAHIRAMGERLDGALHEALGNHPSIGDIRGRGLFRAVELVADRAAKTPFPAAANLHGRIKRQAMAHGLICYPSGGTADGATGDHVLLAPPFIVDAAQIDEIADKLRASIAAALNEIAE
jgi:adenosylmethionine-8-amino-7-oxononanoate aminotransferase